MKNLVKIFVVTAAAILFALPDLACSTPVLVVCRRYVAEGNCHKCSDYFYVNSEDEAQRRCDKLGATPYYFPGVGAMEFWMRGNCPCPEMDRAPR